MTGTSHPYLLALNPRQIGHFISDLTVTGQHLGQSRPLITDGIVNTASGRGLPGHLLGNARLRRPGSGNPSAGRGQAGMVGVRIWAGHAAQ